MDNKLKTQKDYQERINRTIIYIQEHMSEDISLSDLAKVSNFSVFHFHRIFTAYTGESVNAYLRRLRIQHAAGQLIHTNDSITDIAYAAGFETSASFSKAFKNMTGISPRALRQRGTLTEYETPCSSMANFSGDIEMQPTIKTIEDQKVIFIRRSGSYFNAAPDAWKSMGKYVDDNGLNVANVKLIGIAHDDPAVTPEENWRFDACVAGLENPTADGEVGVQIIPGGKYAVFEHMGAYNTLGNTYRKIYGSWFPSTNHKLKNAPAFCHYVNRDFTINYGQMLEQEKAKLITHIYVPIE